MDAVVESGSSGTEVIFMPKSFLFRKDSKSIMNYYVYLYVLCISWCVYCALYIRSKISYVFKKQCNGVDNNKDNNNDE